MFTMRVAHFRTLLIDKIKKTLVDEIVYILLWNNQIVLKIDFTCH